MLKESETIEFKKSTAELKGAVVSFYRPKWEEGEVEMDNLCESV